MLGQSVALGTNLKDPWGEAGRIQHRHHRQFGAGAPPLQGWGALVGAGTPGNQGQGRSGEQVAMLGWLRPERVQGLETPSSGPGGWVGQEGHATPPALGGAREMLTWHHGGRVAQGGEGERVP